MSTPTSNSNVDDPLSFARRYPALVGLRNVTVAAMKALRWLPAVIFAPFILALYGLRKSGGKYTLEGGRERSSYYRQSHPSDFPDLFAATIMDAEALMFVTILAIIGWVVAFLIGLILLVA